MRKTVKYKCIEASIRELGLIEPLVVFPRPDAEGCYMLLDGHVRLMILKALGRPRPSAWSPTDDEGFTYNHKVNRLSAIQEHFMILRAIKNGVSEERIARSLNVDVASIRQKRDLLDGICPEAVQLLRDRRATRECLAGAAEGAADAADRDRRADVRGEQLLGRLREVPGGRHAGRAAGRRRAGEGGPRACRRRTSRGWSTRWSRWAGSSS